MTKVIKKRAFSLIELSVVIIIIGLLITVVTAGKSLFRASKVSAAKALTLSSQITSISGMVFWAETSTTDSFISTESIDEEQLTTWHNLEPSNFLTGNNLTTSASSNVLYEENGINGIPTIKMTTSGNMSNTNFVGGPLNTSTVVIVFKPTVTVSTSSLVISDAGASGNSTSSIAIRNNLININAGSSATSSTSTNAASFTINGKYIVMVYFNGSSSKVFSNDITEVGGSGATLSAGSNVLDGLTIGTNKSGSSGLAADVSEVIVYNRVLTTSERISVMKYLSQKYKITVDGI
jgi:prepilin-type N-terminal cleavage/methylation domain-containing protein